MNGASPQALYFRLGELTLAVPGDGLRQVVTVSSLTRVPRVGPELLGLFSVRGEVLPLIDLRPLLGLEAEAGANVAGRPAALLEHAGRRIALLLGEVLGFLPVYEAALTPDPALAPLTRFMSAHDALNAALLEPGSLLDALERQLVLV